MPNGPPEPTIKDVHARVVEVKAGIATLHTDIEELRNLIVTLQGVVAELQRLSKEIKEKTDILPKEFTRAGAMYKVK